MNTELCIAQSSRQIGRHHWSWAVWIDAPVAILDEIDHVNYLLHSTFANPNVCVKTRRNNFRLNGSGWGGFLIRARVEFRGGGHYEVDHQLTLSYEADPDAREPRFLISYAAGDGILANQLANELINRGIDVAAVDGGYSDVEDPSEFDGVVVIIPPRITPRTARDLKSLPEGEKPKFVLVPAKGRDVKRLETIVMEMVDRRHTTMVELRDEADMKRFANQCADSVARY